MSASARAPFLIRRGLLLAIFVALGAVGCGGGDDDQPIDAATADGPPSACGLEEPGTRCMSSTVLERCNGAMIEQVDCAADGRLCGPDPANPTVAEACVGSGDACGGVSNDGACAGTVLVYCSSQSMQLVATDCAGNYSICAFTGPDGYDCTTQCALDNVTPEGECQGNAIHRCRFEDGSYNVVDDACPTGTTCQTVDETGWPGCLPSASCTNIGPSGKCTGDTLTLCVGGAPQNTNCAATGQVCGYGGDATGYTCAPAGTMGAFQVNGTIRYEDRPPLPSGLGPIGTQLVRGAAVAVVADADGAVLASAVTSDDGSYLLRYDAALGAQVHVLVAAGSATPARPLRVIRPDGLLHGFGSASFAAAAMTTTDVLVTDFSGVSEGFNVFDMLVMGLDYARTAFAVAAPKPLTATWVRGATDGTYYWDSLDGMFLLGEVSDDDGYDDTVILHEMGHYIEDNFGRSDSPGGGHDGSPTDPRLAWSEGFATYWNMAVRGLPLYMDSNAGGGWSFNAETSLTTAAAAGSMTQEVSEDMVAEILWDVSDRPMPDDDTMLAGTETQVLTVEHIFATSPQCCNRGRTGMELVDWLDGWFVENGLASCAELRSIVTTTHMFPYDFNGMAGLCP